MSSCAVNSLPGHFFVMQYINYSIIGYRKEKNCCAMYPCTALDKINKSSDRYKFQMGPVKRSTDKSRVLKSFEKRVA